MHNFKELRVWQKGIDVVEDVYEVTRTYPESERHNLITQMQRAATSIPLNIAEGCGRGTKPVFKQFLGHALGSSYELETQIIVSKRLGFISNETEIRLLAPLNSLQRMLNKLIDTL
jgi:four helix bundle protein